jgi:hypothetical protein
MPFNDERRGISNKSSVLISVRRSDRLCKPAHIYPAPQDVVTAPLIETPVKQLSSGPIEEDIQDPASELRRIPIPRTPVNRGRARREIGD